MTTRFTQRLLIVVAAAAVREANDAAVAAVGEAAGRHTFVARLHARGSAADAPPSHAICHWRMTPAERTALMAGLQPLINAGTCRVYDTSASLPGRDQTGAVEQALTDTNTERDRLAVRRNGNGGASGGPR